MEVTVRSGGPLYSKEAPGARLRRSLVLRIPVCCRLGPGHHLSIVEMAYPGGSGAQAVVTKGVAEMIYGAVAISNIPRGRQLRKKQ